MLYEIHHVEQYQRFGGIDGFANEYMLHLEQFEDETRTVGETQRTLQAQQAQQVQQPWQMGW